MTLFHRHKREMYGAFDICISCGRLQYLDPRTRTRSYAFRGKNLTYSLLKQFQLNNLGAVQGGITIMDNLEKYHITRQIILDLLEALVLSNGFANSEISKLHIDAATDKIEGVWVD